MSSSVHAHSETEPSQTEIGLVEPVACNEDNVIALGLKKAISTPRERNSEIPISVNKDPDILGLYLDDIGEEPLLTKEDEQVLAKVMEAGRAADKKIKQAVDKQLPIDDVWLEQRREGNEAKDRFMRANLRLVVSIARKYPVPANLELKDLIQDGNLGLDRAVDKFNWRKGFKFSTYATLWIRQAIGRGIDQKASIIAIPVNKNASLRTALREADHDDEKLDQKHKHLHLMSTTTSLDQPVGAEGDNELVDILPDSGLSPEEIVTDIGYERTKTQIGSCIINKP